MNHSPRSWASLVFTGMVVLSACGDGTNDKQTPKQSGGSQKCMASDSCDNSSLMNGVKAVDADIVLVSCDGVIPDALIIIKDQKFNPARVEIENGDIVRWVNRDTEAHTVTSGVPGADDVGAAFDSGALSTGQSVCYQFHTVANFTYFCDIHPEQMRDAVVGVHRSDDDRSDDNTGNDPVDGVN